MGLIAVLWLVSCDSAPHHSYVIGISQCMTDDEWRETMIQEVMIEAANYDSLKIEIRDAHSNSEEQIHQIHELIDRGVDILVVSPFESEPLVEVVEKAYRAGIPTIITDRRVNTDCYTTFIGADNQKIGELAGQFAASNLPKGGKILEIWGLPGSSPAMERHRGFVSSLAKRKDIVCDSVHGNWLYDDTRKALLAYDSLNGIDIIYAHNDIMAIAAREMMQEKKISRPIMVMGVDAVTNTGLKALQEGQIDVSFLYPTGGEQVIRTAIQILRGESVPKEIPLYTTTIDKNAAQTLLLQNHQRRNYQKRIMEQRDKSNQLLSKYEFLQNSLWIISLLTVCSAISLIYVYLMNNKIIRINRELLTRNEKEEEQNRKLISLNAEIKEVTAQKLRLFTDVSHEVRTPLTLILSPLEQLQSKTEGTAYENDIKLIYRNASRLLRVINQVLDFQRLESGADEKWHFVPVNLTTFLQDIKGYFDGMASIRHITYNFVCPEEKCEAFIDRDKMEKVIVNLLSNAFKFTPEYGSITLGLTVDNSFIITVEDTGKGIEAKRLDSIFERFHTGDSRSGSGIGLYLVKEYVNRHCGNINVESEPGVKTRFTISLQKGNAHLNQEEIETDSASQLTTEVLSLDSAEANRILSSIYEEKILIVDDEDEVRDFLKKVLSTNFKVATACNGKEALSVLSSENISLVLSDVMMPDINGFELCHRIKKDESTAHIPVLLLTALTDIKQQIHGISEGADGYIQKPFHINYLKVRIASLIEERRKWKKNFENLVKSQQKEDKRPDDMLTADELFLRQYMQKLELFYSDSDFGVERLSEELALSRGHLYRKVKELTGLSPVESLRNYRLEKALELLQQNQYTISEIAYNCGFSSPAYFTKCFRIVYGKTPTEMQNI